MQAPRSAFPDKGGRVGSSGKLPHCGARAPRPCQCLNYTLSAAIASLSNGGGSPYDDFPTPSEDEVKRTIGPIVRALADVVSPVFDGLPDKGYKERLGIDFESVDPRDDIEGGTEREETLKRRLGVHAAAYLAREAFGCPGLEGYVFHTDQGGVISLDLDGALDVMESLDGVGGMSWDAGGGFAAFLSGFGGDAKWLSAAAAIAMVSGKLSADESAAGRNCVLEEVHHRCWEFTREYLSQVHGEMAACLPPGRRGQGAAGRAPALP